METISNDPDLPLRPQPLVLLLLDGYGIAPASEANAVSEAKTKYLNSLLKEYPVAVLNPGDKSLNARYLSLGAGRDFDNENDEPVKTLTEIISDSGLKQLKIMEAERLAALTHFFNGHLEEKIIGEEWITVSAEINNVVKSPLFLKRTIKEIDRALRSDNYDFIVISFPILDQIAQSGTFDEVRKMFEEIDGALKKVVSMVLGKKGTLIISSAHGNIERMKNLATDFVDRKMTSNPIPVIIVGEEFMGKTIGLDEPIDNDLSLLTPAGTLADIAPTILKIMNLDKPVEMTGESLV